MWVGVWVGVRGEGVGVGVGWGVGSHKPLSPRVVGSHGPDLYIDGTLYRWHAMMALYIDGTL